MGLVFFVTGLFLVQTIAMLGTYILVAMDVIQRENELVKPIQDFIVSMIVKFIQIPLWKMVMFVTCIALFHQYIMFNVPSVIIFWMMGNFVESKSLSSGFSAQMENMSVFIRQRPWLMFVMIPVFIYMYIATLAIQNIELITDPTYSLTLLWTICVPMIVSMGVWHLEEMCPENVRRVIFRKTDDDASEPSPFIKRKVVAVSIVTILLIAMWVFTLRMNSPTLMQFLLGRKLDSKLYIYIIGAAVGMSGAVVSVILDGQTKTENDWKDDAVYEYFHRILVLMCLVIFITVAIFPMFNNQFFSDRMMRTSVL